MKLVTYLLSGEKKIGVISTSGNIVDVTDIVKTNDMNVLIENYACYESSLKMCSDGLMREVSRSGTFVCWRPSPLPAEISSASARTIMRMRTSSVTVAMTPAPPRATYRPTR